jgi:hypothetical protein
MAPAGYKSSKCFGSNALSIDAYLPFEGMCMMRAKLSSARGLSLFDDANEASQAHGIDVAYGDDFEIAGLKTADVESGVFC